MPEPIEFYFELSSPFGYLGAMRIDEVAARHGRKVKWIPFLLGAVMKQVGTRPLVEYPIKGEYSKHDFARSTRRYGVPFKLPSQFPIAAIAPCRAVIWARGQGEGRDGELAKAYYRAFFQDDRDISDREVALDVASEQGFDRQAVAAGIADEDVKAELKDEVARGIERGVFGSPFFFVDGEPFWGADRLDMIEEWLEKGGW